MARILFVDDDLFTLDTYSTIMTFFGHESLTADTGLRAIEIACEQQPDFIVVDMNLPDLHGFDLLRRLSNNPATARIPAVMVSASPEAIGKGATQAGAKAFLSKPLRPEELLAIIEQYTTA
ncbi:MAG: response regulator [Anaerolineales bacterium]|nr:response regulator [Anaerolineales bacterium]